MSSPPPVSLEELATLTTWDDALAFASRGIAEERTLKAALPDLETTYITARNTFEAAKDRRAALAGIMQALIARAPELS
jgi:hypothetical protein